jgi:LysR family hydrogen peroxide-inducible transcriptional activator
LRGWTGFLHVPVKGKRTLPTLRQLEYLVAVADTRHFGRAAERVHVTQPTLSEQLRTLERRLGVQLVERSRSNVVVTPLGFEVVEIARRMLRDAQRIRDVTGHAGSGMRGVLRLGLPSTIGPYLLPRVAPRLHAVYPQLKLYVREELPHVLPRGLAEGLHDVIVAPLPVNQSGLREAVLFEEPLHLAVPLDHELAKRESIRVQDLKGVDLLALGPGYQLRDLVVNLAAESGANIRFDYEGTSLDTLREMMATGLGVSLMPGLYVRSVVSKDPRFKTFDIGRRGLKRTIGMLWRKTKTSQPNFERLAALFRETVADEFAEPRAQALAD